MQEYEIKRGHFSKIIGGKLEEILKEIFGGFSKNEDGSYETSFGALAKLRITVKDKSVLIIETTMDTKVETKVASETIKKYNTFLEAATGFTSKERSKRLQKKAKEGGS